MENSPKVYGLSGDNRASYYQQWDTSIEPELDFVKTPQKFKVSFSTVYSGMYLWK
jgi:hypothetical protein